MSVVSPVALTCAITLALVGCNGGSPGGGAGVPDDGGGTDAPDTGDDVGGGDGLNGSLSGQLIIERRLLDLSTGRYDDDVGASDLRNISFLSASRDGRNFYYVLPDCRDRPERAFLDFGCVVVLDAAGTEIDRLDPGLDLSTWPPDVSPDGRFLAVSSIEIHGPQRVLILGPDGRIVDDADRGATPDDVAWGTDGSLFYVADGSAFRATVGDPPTNDQRLISFDETQGSPTGLSISPDGTQLAIELNDSERSTEQSSSVWLMNVDGSELRRFATVSAGSRATVQNPIWSPDGRRLLVSAGGFSLFTGRPTPLSPDFGGGLFALDTSVASHALDTFGSGDADAQILVRFVCSQNPNGCEFGDERGVNGWVP